MTTLNGLTRPWHSFIHTLCSRKESMKFDIVWEDCIQEEARVANREALLREDDQALAIHTKGRKQSNFKKGNNKPQRISFKIKRRITQSINTTTVIREDILLENVHHQKTTTTKDVMLI